jgi:hypothetical protein
MQTVDISVMGELNLILWYYLEKRNMSYGTIVVDVTLIWRILAIIIEEFAESSLWEG